MAKFESIYKDIKVMTITAPRSMVTQFTHKGKIWSIKTNGLPITDEVVIADAKRAKAKIDELTAGDIPKVV